MEYVTLGKSDLKVSRICMGCMGFGNATTGQHSWTVDEETTKSIIKKGLELGIGYYLLLLMLTFVTGCSASRATAVYKYREIRGIKYGDK